MWGNHFLCMMSSCGALLMLLGNAGCHSVPVGSLKRVVNDDLQNQKTLVVCREDTPLATNSQFVKKLSVVLEDRLAANVREIKIVSQEEIEQHTNNEALLDERALARALNADKILYVEIRRLQLSAGNSANSEIDLLLRIRDMDHPEKTVWEYLPPTIRIDMAATAVLIEDPNADVQNQLLFTLADRKSVV